MGEEDEEDGGAKEKKEKKGAKEKKNKAEDSQDEELQNGGCLLDGDAPPTGNEGQGKKKKKNKQAYDTDSDEEEKAEEDKATSIEYDPQDRESMRKCVLKMVTQLKNIEIQMQVLMKELERTRRQTGGK